mmetsp:Transcript_5601/g.14183  ORF Transcript_5601/g.14183 Transcript_5601/m.14183 type:complete len:508 (-) Transcript_5601:452-1975(-)
MPQPGFPNRQRDRRGSLTEDYVSCPHAYFSTQGRREYQEDIFQYQRISGPNGGGDIFAVIDGHSGARAGEYLQANLCKMIEKHFLKLTNTGRKDIERAVSAAFQLTDQALLKVSEAEGWDDGAVCTMILVKDNQLFCANLGDSRTVLCRLGHCHDLSDDHKPNKKKEKQRIEAAGGKVMVNANGISRVNGTLAISRSFGDRKMKPIVSSEPEITFHEITPGDDFVILASDGVWDAMSSQAACTIVTRANNIEASSKEIIELALVRGGQDNMTACVVDLRPMLGISRSGEPSGMFARARRASLTSSTSLSSSMEGLSLTSDQEVIANPVLFHGWLFKRPRNSVLASKEWQKRYYVLKTVTSSMGRVPILMYVGSEAEMSQKGPMEKSAKKCMPLSTKYTCRIENECHDKSDGVYAFSVQDGRSKEVVLLSSQSLGNAQQWVEKINLQIPQSAMVLCAGLSCVGARTQPQAQWPARSSGWRRSTCRSVSPPWSCERASRAEGFVSVQAP